MTAVAAPPVGSEAGCAPSPAATRRGGGRSSLVAVALLIAIPTVIFAGAALVGGHLLLAGDNLIQNYPLRVLAGSQLRGGHLPVWDPYAFGGTPLMAGLNVGAFFPTTLLFVVFPAHLAWVLGEILLYGSVGVGTFLLLRAGGAAVWPCFLGAATFAFAGAVTTQMSVHFDMGGGIACLPWALLAVRKVVEDGRWRWCVLLGSAIALAVLAGSPEALLGTVAATAAFGVLHLSLQPGNAGRFAARTAVAAAAAAGATAFLWLPALRFIAVSQRAHVSLAAAAGFSLPPRSGLLALVPYLEGGDKLVGQGIYFGQSNSGEVTFYVGILPVVAVLALLARHWGALLPRGERRCWYGVLAVAVVMATAAGTPLEHLIYHVPFYGRQRDSGRAVVEIDLAVCALFTWWVDGGRQPGQARRRVQWVAGLAPAAVVAAVGAWYAADPKKFWRELHVAAPSARPAGVTAAIVIALALAVGAAVLAVVRPWLSRRVWLAGVSLFTAVDLGLFAGGSAYLSSHPAPDAPTPGPVLSLVARSLSPGGRYVFFDPSLFYPATSALAGEPDTGILVGLPSAEGYGSLVDGQYAAATATVDRDYVSPPAMRAGVFDDLGLQVVVTLPESFLTPVVKLRVGPRPPIVVEQPGTDPLLPAGTAQEPGLPGVRRTAPPRAPIGGGQTAAWWFGTSVGITTALVQFPPAATGRVVRVGLLGSGSSSPGAVAWGPAEAVPPGAERLSVPLPGSTPAAGIAVQLVRGGSLGPIRVSLSAGGRLYAVDGALADTVVPGAWAVAGSADGYVVFRSTAPAPQVAWLDGGTGGDVSVVARSASSLTVAVHAAEATDLVVGEAYALGWRASVAPSGSGGGAARTVAVTRHGLVQAVPVPAGSSTVTLTYAPPGLAPGALVTAATLLALVLFAGAVQVRRRRRPVPPPA